MGTAPGAAARPGRASGATFSYRVVARRTAPNGTRGATQAPPDFSTVKPAPKPPEPPRAPDSDGDKKRG